MTLTKTPKKEKPQDTLEVADTKVPKEDPPDFEWI